MTQRIDRSELMRLAWSYAKQDHWSRRRKPGTLRSLFPGALKRAWADMKARARAMSQRAAAAVHADPEALRLKIFRLDQKTRLGPAGHRELAEARQLLAAVTAQHSNHLH